MWRKIICLLPGDILTARADGQFLSGQHDLTSPTARMKSAESLLMVSPTQPRYSSSLGADWPHDRQPDFSPGGSQVEQTQIADSGQQLVTSPAVVPPPGATEGKPSPAPSHQRPAGGASEKYDSTYYRIAYMTCVWLYMFSHFSGPHLGCTLFSGCGGISRSATKRLDVLLLQMRP